MAQRRKEERVRKAELNRLDNEECGEEEEEEEDMTDESEEEEVKEHWIFFLIFWYFLHDCPFSSFYPHIKPKLLFYQNVDDLLGGDGEAEDDEEEASVVPSIRSPSPVALNGPSSTPDLVNTDGTLILFPGSSCSRTGYAFVLLTQTL